MAALPGRIEYQCEEKGGDDLPAIFHGRPKLGVGVRASDEGRRPVIPCLPKVEGPMPGFLRVPGSQVTGGALPVPEKGWPGGGGQGDNTTTPAYTQLYQVSFPKTVGLVECPSKGCRGRGTIQDNLRIHFVHRHVRDKIVILEEGNHLHPQLPNCDIFLPWLELDKRHSDTAPAIVR